MCLYQGRRMYSRWLSGLGSARNYASHSHSVAELERVNPWSVSSSAPAGMRTTRSRNTIPAIAKRRIVAPDFLLQAAASAARGTEAYCKEIAEQSLEVFSGSGFA